MVDLTEAHDGQTIEATAGTQIRVCLPEIPSTGFRWEVQSIESERVQLVDSHRIAGADAPGARLSRCFVLECRRGGHSELVIALRRPWEQGAQQLWRVSLEIAE